MKKNIILSAALMFLGLTAQAQIKITFDTDDYKAISVYDSWEKSPFRTGVLEGNAAVASNPDTEVDAILGEAPNATGKVVAFQRSRYASNTYGVRIDLKEPIRVTKQLQYIHVMTYLKNKPADSRMMVIGLGKRLEESLYILVHSLASILLRSFEKLIELENIANICLESILGHRFFKLQIASVTRNRRFCRIYYTLFHLYSLYFSYLCSKQRT